MLTKKQDWKYWRTWGAICAAQGWAHESSARKTQRRHELHQALKLPDSHTAWTNPQFSRFLHGTAHLLNQVDIRDRDRENAIWTIERLRGAFQTVLGRDYARALMIDWRDSIDLDNFPLQSASLLDLQNLRNTLKNRLGRVIQRIKDGELQAGPDCPDFRDYPQAAIIDALVSKKPLQAPPARKTYALDPSLTFQGRGGMEYGTASVPAQSRPPAAPSSSAKPPAKRTEPDPAGSSPAAPAKKTRKYCMH